MTSKIEDQKLWQIALEIIFLAALIGFGLFLWEGVGPENWAAWWKWQWLPYNDLWAKHGEGGRAEDYAGAAQLLGYAVVAIVLLLLFLRVSVLLAKWFLGYAVAVAALAHQGVAEVEAPSALLIGGVVVALLWLVLAVLILKGSLRQWLKNLWRRWTS